MTQIEIAIRAHSDAVDREPAGLSGLLSVPAGHAPVPVLLFLHGRGEARVGLDGNRQSLQAVGRHEAPITSPAALERFAVVAPQAPTSAGADIWAGRLDLVAALVRQARQTLAMRDDGRLFVCGFSQGAFAAVEYVGVYKGDVVAWVGVDAARRVPVKQSLVTAAGALPHLLLAGPAGFRRNPAAPDDPLGRDEIALPGLTHVGMCAEVYSGRLRLGSGDSVYDWLLRHGRLHPLPDPSTSRPVL